MTSQDTATLLRLEVGRLRAHESRRSFDTVVHLGTLGGASRACPVPRTDPVLDNGTRAEVVSALLEAATADESTTTGSGKTCVWLTRAGEPQVQDEDLRWLAAAWLSFGAVGRSLDGFWTVTRTGWLDVRSGECRTWKRLRV